MKIGDKVRFLSEVGGGVVTGFQGKDMVLVEDADGFDIPMPIKECVVIASYGARMASSNALQAAAAQDLCTAGCLQGTIWQSG